MEVTREKLKYYFETAKKYKEDIKSSYNETFEFTDPTFAISDSDSETKSSDRNINSTILKSQNFLCNFIMSSVFSKSGTWATIKVNKELIKGESGVDGEGLNTIADEIDKILEANSETVYLNNDITNYYTETNKSLLDCIKVGTGIRKVIELKSNTKPFTYSYQNLDNIYILEDNLGKPNIIFKKYLEKNLQDINDLFGHLGIKKPSELTSEEELKEKINLIESVVGIFDENTATYKYYHSIHTDDFTELLLEELLEYNPYTVFRWSVDSSNPWGIGIGRANLDLFRDLKRLKEKRAKHIEKIVSPPVNFFGNIDLINKVSLKPNAVNYAGSGFNGDRVGVEPINTGTNLVPIEEDIKECLARIREIYMAQPLGDVDDTKNRSATEMSLRHEMFRKEFSGTYELLNTELLEPTFMNAYYILDKKGLLKKPEKENFLNYSNIQYINELTRNAGSEQVFNTVNYFNTMAQIVPEEQRNIIFKTDELIDWAAKKMRIPMEILNSKEEMGGILEQQQKLQQMQQMAMIQESIGKRQDIGIQEKLEQGVDVIE